MDKKITATIWSPQITAKVQKPVLQADVYKAVTGGVAADEYRGETVITPKLFEDQTLFTKDKILKDNITVLEIPISKVSNTSGGNTVIIGG